MASRFPELTRKALEYLGAKASLVWVLDPHAREVVVYTPPDHVRVLRPEDTLDGGTLLPGLSCRVSEPFETLP